MGLDIEALWRESFSLLSLRSGKQKARSVEEDRALAVCSGRITPPTEQTFAAPILPPAPALANCGGVLHLAAGTKNLAAFLKSRTDLWRSAVVPQRAERTKTQRRTTSVTFAAPWSWSPHGGRAGSATPECPRVMAGTSTAACFHGWTGGPFDGKRHSPVTWKPFANKASCSSACR